MFEELESRDVFKYFEQISGIPRQSGHEKLISNYLVDFAQANNLEYTRDAFDNVLMKKPASDGYENAPTIILQSHMDMVCVKTSESSHDFSKDPIELVIDGDKLKAKYTSLGADDGIGMAITLAILESKKIQHPNIEAIFTVDEENTMLGAEKFDISQLKSKILFNLDGEDENIFVAGSGGATNLNITYDVELEKNTNPAYEIKINGLLGGHSAIEISNEHANAIVLMARIFLKLKSKLHFSLADIFSGERTNIIPSQATATITLAQKDFDIAKNIIADVTNDFKNEFKNNDPGLTVEFKKSDKKFDLVLADNNLDDLISSILIIPNGVINRNLKLNGVTETSNNIGTIRFENKKIIIGSRIRSSMASRDKFVLEQIKSVAKMFGATVEILTTFPAWDYNPESKLISFCKKIYEHSYNKQPVIEATHGGLECSYFKQIPGIDIICIGPNIYNCHSVNEVAEIKSIDRFWRFFKQVLAQLKNY